MSLDELKDEALKDPEVKREYDELDLLLPDEMEFNYDNVFTVEDDIYTIRKAAYIKGQRDVAAGIYEEPKYPDCLDHYLCGRAYGEWVKENNK